MTNREFLTAVINANVSTALTDFAKAEIEKLDAKNSKRKNTPNKTQIENAEHKKTILECLAESPSVASALAETLGLSTQKVSALCGQLVKEGKLSVTDKKVKGKSSVKEYSLVEDIEADEE